MKSGGSAFALGLLVMIGKCDLNHGFARLDKARVKWADDARSLITRQVSLHLQAHSLWSPITVSRSDRSSVYIQVQILVYFTF